MALAGARALAEAGWFVGVGSPPPRGPSARSRAVGAWHPVPAAEDDPEGFLDATAAAIKDGGYDLVFACDDVEVLALSEHRDRLRARVAWPAHEAVVRSFDKLELTLTAQRVGLGVPRTEPATDEALAAWTGPAVVKSRLHGAVGVPARMHAALVDDAQEAAARVAELRALGGEPFLQEQVSGTLVGFATVIDADGAIVASFQQEADEIWPMPAGGTVRGRGVPVDAELEAGVARLLRELGWTGLAQLQFLTGADGVPRLIDFNGRFYGSLALASAAGLNLPAAWAAIATGRPVPPLVARDRELRYQKLEDDITRAKTNGGLASCATYAMGAVHTIWSASDPAPAVAYGARKLTRAARRRLPRRAPA